MILQRLKVFLDSHQIKYIVIMHSPAYTSLEIAALAHIPGKEVAKSVIVNADGKMLMVVLPASHMVDFNLLSVFTGAKNVELAGEQEFKHLFPECELGAMPPFGNLFTMDVLVSETLAEDEMIAFNAGTHKELVKMTYRDFVQLVQPKVGKLSFPKRYYIPSESWEMP
ncbi:MAG: YbaK/EbsC family protein [Ignavibacteriales bacterium]|nr:YbaK/EbsC family protein [Ignavibacteriales bacterium]